MSVNRYWMPVIIVTALLGTVLGSQALGLWAVSGRSDANLNNLTPDTIKGWMTLQQVADGMNLPVDIIYELASLPTDITPNTALKDIEGLIDGFEISTLREGLTAYLAAGAVTALPVEPAVDAVPALETPSAPTTTPVPGGQGAPVDAPHTGDGTGPTPLPSGEILPASAIKGRMTLREVSEQCAVDLDALLAALGLPATTDPDVQLKDMIQDGRLGEVTEVQDAVSVLQAGQ